MRDPDRVVVCAHRGAVVQPRMLARMLRKSRRRSRARYFHQLSADFVRRKLLLPVSLDGVSARAACRHQDPPPGNVHDCASESAGLLSLWEADLLQKRQLLMSQDLTLQPGTCTPHSATFLHRVRAASARQPGACHPCQRRFLASAAAGGEHFLEGFM